MPLKNEVKRLNTEEASELTGYSVNTIQRWCREGMLDAIWEKSNVRGQWVWMIEKQSLLEFIADNKRRLRHYSIYCPYCGIFFPAENDVCPDCGRRDERFEPVWDGK